MNAAVGSAGPMALGQLGIKSTSMNYLYIQGVHQILCFFEDFKIYSGLGFPSVLVCVHSGRSNTSTAAELAEFRKITTF